MLDSGVGGENTVREIRRRSDVDLILMKDTKNAPYGTLAEDELVGIVDKNIKELLSLGASRVLIACCTASSVWHKLTAEAREGAIPIISATAKMARDATEVGKIAVLATAGTVSRHAFARALSPIKVRELAAGELVGMIEGGVSDGTVSPRDVRRISLMLSPLRDFGADTLVLGCTHFPSLLRTVRSVSSGFGIKNVVSSAEAAASALLCECRECGTGRTEIIDTGA